jgi:hypothetical protein
MTDDSSNIRENWSQVDSNLHSVRRQLQLAKTAEDFQAVGVLSRETIISLGQAVLNDTLTKQLPGVSNTDAEEILAKYFEIGLPRSSNESLRHYSKSCLSLAKSLQHMRNVSYVEAELCTEACAHLVLLVRIIFFEQLAPPMERFRHARSASAESRFITSWVFAHFDEHPVAKENGFKIKGFMFQGSEVSLIAERSTQRYTVTIHQPYWWKGANRLSAEALIDELMVQLLTQLDKEHFKRTGQPPA